MSESGLIAVEAPVPADETLPGSRIADARVNSPPSTEAGGGEEPPAINPFGMVLRTLRGRILYAVILGAGLGSVLGAGGYMAKDPTYSSGGIVQLFPIKTSILYNDRDDSRLRLFDAFANAEALFMTSTPVLELATEQTTLKQIGWPSGMPGVGRLKSAVTAERKGGLIFVTASNDNPEFAAAVVNGVLNAYMELHQKQLKDQDRVRERELSNRERELVGKMGMLDKQVVAVGQEYGATSIASAHVRKIAQSEEVDQRIADLEMQIATKESNETQNNVDIGDQEVKRLLVLDHAMADMLFERSKVAGELEYLKKRHAREHKEVIERESQMKVLDLAIENRRTQLATLGSVGAMTKSGSESESLKDLKSLRDRFVTRRMALQEEARQLNERMIRLEFLSKEREQTREMIEETRKALEQVRVESQHFLPGTVQVRSFGAVPISPSADKRTAFAGAGLLAGLGMGFAAVIGYGLVFHRYRFSDDLTGFHPRVPLVGVLPDMGDQPLEESARFQESLHNLAVELQLRSVGANGTEVLAVTGTREESGSSTVALGLARAFATAHVNTILVDADLKSASVTERMGLGDQAGLREILLAGYLNGELPERSLSTLRVLPAGSAAHMSDTNISRRALAHFLHQLKSKCDLVLLDLGPLNDRTAARMGAALAEHVLLVVPAGDKSSEISPVVKTLEQLSQNRAMAVVNFAPENDPGLMAQLNSAESLSLNSSPSE